MALGKSIPLLDARDRVNGIIEYGTNLRFPGMLHASMLYSPLPHARITRLDATAAEDALYAIDVEYEELPTVYDAREAIQPDAPTRSTTRLACACMACHLLRRCAARSNGTGNIDERPWC